MNYSGFDIEKLFDAVLAFSRSTSPEKLLNVILTKMMEITHSDAGTLYILEDGVLFFRIIKNNTLGISQSTEDTIDLPGIVLSDQGVDHASAYAAIKNEIVLIDDVYDESCNFPGPRAYDKITGYKTRSVLVLPLSVNWDEKTEVLGVIQLLNSLDPKTGKAVPFGDIYNPPVIPALANVAASTLANSLHLKEIQTLFNSFATVMAQTIDERSSFSRHHSHRVAHLCNAFSKYLGRRFPKGHPYHFGEKRKEELSMAAMLHDLGKVVTPIVIMDKQDRLGYRFSSLKYRFELKKHQIENDTLSGRCTEEAALAELAKVRDAMQFIESATAASLLTDEDVLKTQELTKLTYRDSTGKDVPILEPEDTEALSIRVGTLTDKERAIMQEHVSVTGRLLEGIAFSKRYKNTSEWARNHHEFLDGSGYPNGLSADELSIETTIMTIMDIFEALTAGDRPYKESIPTDESLEILTEMANSGKLNKDMVELFIESQVWKELLPD